MEAFEALLPQLMAGPLPGARLLRCRTRWPPASAVQRYLLQRAAPHHHLQELLCRLRAVASCGMAS